MNKRLIFIFLLPVILVTNSCIVMGPGVRTFIPSCPSPFTKVKYDFFGNNFYYCDIPSCISIEYHLGSGSMIEMGILENEGNIGNMRLYIHVYISLTSTFMFKDSKIKLSFPKTGIVKSIIVHEWEFLDFSENPPGAPNSNYKRGNRTDVWIESYWMKMTSEPDESVIIQLPDVVVDGETIHPEPIHFKKI